METTSPYICRLCLFKSEVVEEDEHYVESSIEILNILNDIFKDQVTLTTEEIDAICSTCRNKLNSFHEFYLFVLENQQKYLETLIKSGDDTNLEPLATSNPITETELFTIKEETADSFENEPDNSWFNDAAEPDDGGFNDPTYEPKSDPEKSNESDTSSERITKISPKSKAIYKRAGKKRKRRYRDQSKYDPVKQAKIDEEDAFMAKFFEPKCRFCATLPTFASISKLANHVSSFHGKPLDIKCCNFNFKTRCLYLYHLRKYHADQETIVTFPCHICEKNLPTEKKLHNHLYLEHKYCTVCKDTINRKKSIKSHMQQHAFATEPGKLAPYICHFCDKKLKSKAYLKTHLEGKHLQKVVAVCHLCGINFPKLSMCNAHNKKVHSGAPFKEEPTEAVGKLIPSNKGGKLLACRGFLFAVNGSRPKHNVINWRCCQLRRCTGTAKTAYFDLNSIDSHPVVKVILRKEHTHDADPMVVKKKELYDEIKRRALIDPAEAPSVLAEEIEKLIENDEVAKQLPKKESLLRGIRRSRAESKVTRVSCPHCQNLVRENYLELHIKNIHVNPVEPKVPCTDCSKAFKTKMLMQSHWRKCHADRKFQCQFCEKRCQNMKALKEHEAVHTGIPRHRCETCGAEFKSSGNYGAHRRKLHPVEYEAEKARNRAKILEAVNTPRE